MADLTAVFFLGLRTQRIKSFTSVEEVGDYLRQKPLEPLQNMELFERDYERMKLKQLPYEVAEDGFTLRTV